MGAIVMKTFIDTVSRLVVFGVVFSSAACGGGDAGGNAGGTSGGELQSPAISSAEEGAAMNRKADEDLHLIARIQLDESQVAEFYEPEPGSMLFSVAGHPPPGKAPPRREDFKGLSPAQVFRKIAPGQPVPDAILKSKAGTLEIEPSDAGSGTSSGDPPPAAPGVNPTSGGLDLGQSQSALTTGYCSSQFYSDFPCPSGGYPWCLHNWWGGAYANGTNVVYTYANLCPQINSASLHISTSSGHGGVWSVAQDNYRWWSLFAGQSCNPFCGYNRYNVWTSVGNASSTMFNYIGQFLF
jgi:hypothetical protein